MITKEIAAILSLYVYFEEVDRNLNLPKLPYEGWSLIRTAALTGVGLEDFAYGVFKHTSGQIVIAYRGTDGLSPGMSGYDGLNNGRMAEGTKSLQCLQAAQVYANVLRLFNTDGSNVSFTGHSLGGGLASIMGVWFDRPAIVFDPAPFRKTAENIDRANEALQLLGGGQAPVALRNYVPARDYAARSTGVSGYYAKGEFLDKARFDNTTVNLNAIQSVEFGNQNVDQFTMHSQALLAMGFLSDQFRLATVQVQNALPLVMSKKLYSNETRGLEEQDFLIDLIKSEQTTPDNSKLDSFAIDLQKLGTNLEGLNKAAQEAIIAQSIEWYYWFATGYQGQKYFDATGAALQYTTAKGMGAVNGFDKAQNRAAQYVGPWMAEIAKTYEVDPSTLPGAGKDFEQWNIALNATASASALSAAKTQFMLGGEGSNNLTGGGGVDANVIKLSLSPVVLPRPLRATNLVISRE